MVVLNPNAIAPFEGVACRRVRASGHARERKRKQSAGPTLEFVAADDALLHAKRRQPRQRSLVVAGPEIMPRFHALDRMTVFVHVDEAESNRQDVEGICANFPVGMERRCVSSVANRAKSLPATQVVHAVHGSISLLTAC